MRVLCTLILFLILQTQSNAQCPVDVNLSGAASADSFAVNFPECIIIEGNLTIHPTVQDLSSLTQLISIGGDLIINGGDSLTSLKGFENIRDIGGDLLFNTYPAMTSPKGLEGLVEVIGDLKVLPGPGFTSMMGLNNLNSVGSLRLGSSFFGGDSSELTSLTGLESLVTIVEYLVIERDSALVSLVGLGGLSTVGKGLTIKNNPTLMSLQGLNGLREVGGQLEISRCNSLKSTSALSSLRHVEFDLQISNCALLQNLGSFGSLKTVGAQPWNMINIFELPELTSINGFGGLTDVGSVVINNCNSLTSIAGFGSITSIPEAVSLRSNLSLEKITAFSNLKQIGIALRINNSGEINNLSGFNDLEEVGNLELHDNEMNIISDFNNLVSIGDRLTITVNQELEIITGFQKLSTVGNNINVSGNDALIDCETFCELVSNAPSNLNILISNINGDCSYINQQLQSCKLRVINKIWDANPAFINATFSNVFNAQDLTPSQITQLNVSRGGVAADGVSELILQLKFEEETNYSITQDGFSQLWGTTTNLINGSHLGFVKYTAPETFDRENASIIEGFVQKPVSVFVKIDGDVALSDAFILVPPPIVLVHGTYSNTTTWTKKAAGQLSMKEALEEQGYIVSTVNYESSNGSADPSSFSQNYKMVWENDGGIEEALNNYRGNHKIAVSQADVIGHSMGGVLPRVYASENYNPLGYRRNDNFMQGDINRLITIGSTHHGSHLGELQQFLANGSPLQFGLPGFFAAQASSIIGSWVGGSPPSQAVINQSPESDALMAIGETSVPAHAITLRAPSGTLKDTKYDIGDSYYNLYKYLSLLIYYNQPIADAYLTEKLMLCERGLKATTTKGGTLGADLYPDLTDEQIFKQMLMDGFDRNADKLEAIDGDFQLPANIERFHHAFGDTEMSKGDIFGTDPDGMLQGFKANEEPHGVPEELYHNVIMPTSEDLEPEESLLEAFRSLIFNHDDNDGVVRVESQSGELEKICPECVTLIDSVLHSPAPQHPKVQQRVIDLLNNGMSLFHMAGFPSAGRAQLLYYPPVKFPLYAVPKKGVEAICASGIVPSHAENIARVADDENVIILARPVNSDATPLIWRGAATKEMDVKPKSATWGPQKGYLPVFQRYSKLWKVYEGTERNNKIAEYDPKAQENLLSGITKARQLTIKTCQGKFALYIDQAKYSGPDDLNAADEIVLVPLQESTLVCHWEEKFDPANEMKECEPLTGAHQLIPFEVMATSRVFEKDGTTPRYLTADYDLLMIGFFEGENLAYDQPDDIPFQEGIGQITTEQKELVDELNMAIEVNAGYTGGALTHHGPENQFNKSPYIDYPITVFMPDDEENGFFNGPKGEILSIDMGPPGFRDIHLKRFVNRMRKKGYDLLDNPEAPGWHWTWSDNYGGFELADSPEMGDYVNQLPKNTCGETGLPVASPCPAHLGAEPLAASADEGFEDWLFGRSSFNPFSVELLNNKIKNDFLYVNIETNQNRETSINIFNTMGSLVMQQDLNLITGETQEVFNIAKLPYGMYYLKIGTEKVLPFMRL